MIKHYFLFLLSLVSTSLYAREMVYKDAEANKLINGTNLLRYTDHSSTPNYIQFIKSATFEVDQLQLWMNKNLNLHSEYGLLEMNRTTDPLGLVHIRYRQTYHGIPIQGSMYIAHTRQGVIESLSGVVYNDIHLTNLQPLLSEASTLQNALIKVNADIYKWQLAEEEKALKEEEQNQLATYFPKAMLYILKSKDTYHLCHAFNIYAHKPMGRTMEYVDTKTGEVILSRNLIEHINTNGTAVTKYSGTKPFQTDSTAPTNFRLRDDSRGLGISTYNMQTGTTTAGSVDFLDTDNTWNNVNAARDEAATDAQWGAQKTYDYLFTKHGRNSIDNAGFALKSYVHYDVDYANAFWNGTRMTYGDGDFAVGFNVMTGLDVCGHEIGHGLVTFTADLSGSSGGSSECDALNEGFADIIGTAVERYSRPSQWDWKIGGDITCSSTGVPNGQGLRSMSNPFLFGDPKCYQGTNWNTSGEPHANAGPLDHWFYLLTTGSIPDNITALGNDTAEYIAYRALTVHLFPNADYADTRFYTILASSELYGACSTPTISTTNAWNKVCVGGVYVPGATVSNFTADQIQTCDTSLTVQFTNTSTNGNAFVWHFGDGTTSTLYNPNHTYSAGVYDVTLIVDGGTCGNDTLVQTAFIQVGPPAGPVTTGATLCAIGSTIISATPNIIGDTIRWYAAPTGGTSLATGQNFTTPVLSSTTTYYAEEKINGPSYHIGPLNNTIGAGANYTNTSRFMIFSCTAPTILVSVWVLAQGAGNRTIILKNSAGTILQTTTVNIPNGGSVVTLNMPIPVGNDMQIGFATGSTVNLYRNSTGAVYPYTNGPISITGNTATGSASYYYFFYDWVVKGDDCYSIRTPTTVLVTTGTAVTPATITPAGPLTVCSPNNVILNANTGTGLSYQWYDGTSMLSGATNSSYTATTTGNYNVVVSSSSGCFTPGTSANAAVVIGTAPIASASASGPTSFCLGGSVLLTANTGTGLSYQWYQNGNPISGATSSNYLANNSGNYHVVVTNTSNCNTASTPITVNASSGPASVINPAGTATYCTGGNILLNASVGVGYTYQWFLNGNPIVGATSNSYAANQVGDYTVQITNNIGCSALSPITTLGVSAPPSATITPNGSTTICQGSSVLLNANAGSGYTYQWLFNGSTITGANAISYAASQTGNYQVVVTSSANCSATSTNMSVTVVPSPVPVIINSGGLLSVTGGSFVSFQWYFNGLPIAGATNSTYTVTQNGTYMVEATTQDGCKGFSASINVVGVGINDLNLASITIHPNPTTDIIQIDGIHPSKIIIRNLQGQIIKENENKSEISIAEFASGIYMMQLYNRDGLLLLNEKIIKQ